MRVRHPMLFLLVALAVAGWLGGAGGAAAQGEEAAMPAATYVGADTCAACHDQLATELGTTPHGKSGFAARATHGCETCHGPGSLHAENPDDPALRPRIDTLPPSAQAAICASCHTGGAQMHWPGSRHETRGISCQHCHSIHSPKSETAQLKAPSAMEQCFACHKDVRAETWKNSHHPIREGEISCTDCHNPHGTTTAKLIKAVSVNDQCYSCHAEKRGPFIWDHPPVRENCMNCHVPHGSNHIKLQKTSVPFICQQCHSNTRHPGTMYDGFSLPTLENEATGSNRLFNRACLDCHSAIHGTNHPSGPYLGR